MFKKLKLIYSNLRIVLNILKEEANNPFKTTLKQKIISLKNGFASDKAIIYSYNKDNIKRFVSDYQRKKSFRINEKTYQIFDNKLMTDRILSPFVKMPKCFFILKEGNATSLASEKADYTNIQNIPKFIKNKGIVVLKPIYGGSGKGVQVVKFEEKSNHFFVNNIKYSNEDLIALLKSLNDVLLTEFIEQGLFGRELYPESTNTMRILTMIDPQNNEPFIAAAAHRVGTDKTKPIDNFGGGKGGISILINKETGVLSDAVTIIDGRKQVLTTHPDTGNRLTGKVVPYWNEIEETLLDTIKRNPFLKYVGWDVVVTEERFAVIEINSYSGLTVLQAHKPIKDYDERIDNFYKYHNVI